MAVFGITWYIYVIGPNKLSYEKQTPSNQGGSCTGGGRPGGSCDNDPRRACATAAAAFSSCEDGSMSNIYT